MKFFKHSNGKTSLYPERIPQGYEYVITPDFVGFWRKRNV